MQSLIFPIPPVALLDLSDSSIRYYADKAHKFMASLNISDFDITFMGDSFLLEW